MAEEGSQLSKEARVKEKGRRVKAEREKGEGEREKGEGEREKDEGEREKEQVPVLAGYFRAMDGTVCYFGRNAAMMALVGNQLKAAGIVAHGFMDEALLMQELDKGHTHLLVLGGGVEDEPRSRLKEYCSARAILVLEHFGGPGSLPSNISSALGAR